MSAGTSGLSAPLRGLAHASRDARERLVARSLDALYRWYSDRAQRQRNWNADRDFAWAELRSDAPADVRQLIQGFYAVEQYAPDYTALLLELARKRYGHAQFIMRWGAEEEKHSDAWRNVLLFSRAQTPEWIEDYTAQLRSSRWQPPFENAFEMLVYSLFQERATQQIYAKTAAIARGERGIDETTFIDPVLARVCTTVSVDEAAHYDFFLEAVRIHLFFLPEESFASLLRVLEGFLMPAAALVPDYLEFKHALHRTRVFGPRQFAIEVVRNVLGAQGRAYMECFMDWNLVFRSRDEVAAFASRVAQSEVAKLEVYTDDPGNVHYLALEKR